MEDLYEQAERRATDLLKTHELLDQWKQRGDDLLCSMLPKSIAEGLRNGKEPVDTCEVPYVSHVTIHFIYAIRFFCHGRDR